MSPEAVAKACGFSILDAEIRSLKNSLSLRIAGLSSEHLEQVARRFTDVAIEVAAGASVEIAFNAPQLALAQQAGTIHDMEDIDRRFEQLKLEVAELRAALSTQQDSMARYVMFAESIRPGADNDLAFVLLFGHRFRRLYESRPFRLMRRIARRLKRGSR